MCSGNIVIFFMLLFVFKMKFSFCCCSIKCIWTLVFVSEKAVSIWVSHLLQLSHIPSSYANLVISHIQLHLSDFIRWAWNQNIVALQPSISRLTSRFLRVWPSANCLNSTALFLPLTLSQTVDTVYIFLPPPRFLQCYALFKKAEELKV